MEQARYGNSLSGTSLDTRLSISWRINELYLV